MYLSYSEYLALENEAVFPIKLRLLSGLLLFFYFVKVSIAMTWMDRISSNMIYFGGYFVLAIVFSYLFFDKNLKVYHSAIFMMILLGITALFSDVLDVAISKWIIWCLLFCVVGPLFKTDRANDFRNLLWSWNLKVIFFITVASFVWIVLGLPKYGKGNSGLLSHCMLLGPVAAIATLSLIIRALSTRKIHYFVVIPIGILTCVASGSRTAVLGLIAGIASAYLATLKSGVKIVFALLTIIIVAISVWNVLDISSRDLESYSETKSIFIQDLAAKRLHNSREQIWKRRLAEFSDSPVVGIGVGVDSSKMTEGNYGTILVEPGSSYLAILSMTGLVGVLAILLLFILLSERFFAVWDIVPMYHRAEILAIGTFWAVHAIAEGWIFAGGSLLSLFFWLWAGRLATLENVVRKGIV